MRTNRTASPVVLVTETTDLSADLLVLELRAEPQPFARINLDRFPTSTFEWGLPTDRSLIKEAGSTHALADASVAWFRRLPSLGAESDEPSGFVRDQWRSALLGLLETSGWAWVNPPSAISRAELKMVQLEAAGRAGLITPDTLVTNDPDAARAFMRKGRTVAKALAPRVMVEDSTAYAVFTKEVLVDQLESEESVRSCPLVLQRLVERAADVRVTVVGEAVFAATIEVSSRQPSEVDWRRVEQSRLRYGAYDLAPGVASRCITLLEMLDLVYGAFDFLLTSTGELVFLEVNPSGQWGWIERAVGHPISRTIVETLLAMRSE